MKGFFFFLSVLSVQADICVLCEGGSIKLSKATFHVLTDFQASSFHLRISLEEPKIPL